MKTITMNDLKKALEKGEIERSKVSTKQVRKQFDAYNDTAIREVNKTKSRKDIDITDSKYIVFQEKTNLGTKKWQDWRYKIVVKDTDIHVIRNINHYKSYNILAIVK